MKKGILVGTLSMLALSASLANTNVQNSNEAIDKSTDNVEHNRTATNPTKLKELSAKEKNAFKKTYMPHTFAIDPGIPPKQYGMHYVKRGTHKRTNV